MVRDIKIDSHVLTKKLYQSRTNIIKQNKKTLIQIKPTPVLLDRQFFFIPKKFLSARDKCCRQSTTLVFTLSLSKVIY